MLKNTHGTDTDMFWTAVFVLRQGLHIMSVFILGCAHNQQDILQEELWEVIGGAPWPDGLTMIDLYQRTLLDFMQLDKVESKGAFHLVKD